ncbi:MAG: hypothetical protein RLO19_09045 [Coleofasciculus sp. G2-EDA-02]
MATLADLTWAKNDEYRTGALEVLNSEVTGIKLKIPGLKLLGDSLGDAGMTSEADKFSLYFGIGEITTRTKSDARLRERLNRYLGSQKNQLVDAINQELIEPAIASLKAIGKNGLVVIVDNLDRLDSHPKDWGRPQQEYLFVDQGDCLNRLHCHVIYTMPLGLKFSDEYGNLTQRFTDEPKVLPMVSVKLPDGGVCETGMNLLRQVRQSQKVSGADGV